MCTTEPELRRRPSGAGARGRSAGAGVGGAPACRRRDGRRYSRRVFDWPDLLADHGSFTRLSGEADSLDAGRATIAGHPVMLVWCRFEVAAGTLSLAAGDRFCTALDLAVAERRPVVAIANSGGARMQEGTRAFMQMLPTLAAVTRVRRAGLPVIVHLAHPTTGGVLASWASAAQFLTAEPGATLGFTGPRVAAMIGEPIEPPEVQTAEGYLAAGHVDAICVVHDLRDRIGHILSVLAPADPSLPPAAGPEVAIGPTGWDAVVASRAPDRTPVIDGLASTADVCVELSGDRSGGTDPSVAALLMRVAGRPMLVLGHRRVDGAPARPTVAGLRLGRRMMRLAGELGIPLVTVVDTAGAHLAGEAERLGLPGEIARSIEDMGALVVPTVAVVDGQGAGGAAIAWMAADTVLATPDSFVAPIAPEAGSVILHRDPTHAAELAELQQVSAIELRDAGIVDAVHAAPMMVGAIVAAIDRMRPAGAGRQSDPVGQA